MATSKKKKRKKFPRTPVPGKAPKIIQHRKRYVRSRVKRETPEE